MPKEISKKEFVLRGIKALRREGSRGIHTKYSGFMNAYKEHFGENAVPLLQEMAEKGEILSHPTKGGYTIYLPEEGPRNSVQENLNKILGDD